ncbi:MAG: hypothetical protein GY828_00825 [Candidatus Gracilibacteria bacterium]|nr:hypothetical protein [Candidatus Gracilibacteria bacterium]
MSWKEVLKKEISKPEKIRFLRYKASKIIFIGGAFTFFVNFFFVGANFYPDFFHAALPYTYVYFCSALFLFLFYFAMEKGSRFSGVIYSLGVGALLMALYVFSILPVFFKDGISYFINI